MESNKLEKGLGLGLILFFCFSDNHPGNKKAELLENKGRALEASAEQQEQRDGVVPG